jgi:hypothetical protein
MHPIEHLRYVARSHGIDPTVLVREATEALGSMRFDPTGLVVACRRIVERHPDCGPLWWACCRILTATDPLEVAWTLPDELDADATTDHLVVALPDDATVLTAGWPQQTTRALVRRGDVRVLVIDGPDAPSFVRRLDRADVEVDLVPAEAAARAAHAADLVLVEAVAASGERLLAPVGSAVVAAVSAGRPVWAVVGLGRSLPGPVVDTIASRCVEVDPPWDAALDVVHLGQVAAVVRPDGVHAPLTLTPDCSLAPELLRASPM